MARSMISRGDTFDTRHFSDEHTSDGSAMAERSCTDVPCLVIFVGYVACMVGITLYAFEHGQPRRLTHGFDYKGNLCGVDEAVADQPMLFWCPKGNKTVHGHTAELDMDHPICVAKCPSEQLISLHCFGEADEKVQITGEAPFQSQMITITQRSVKKHSYPSEAFAGMFCVPHFHPEEGHIIGNEPVVQDLLASHGPIGNGYFRSAMALGGVRRAWRMVVTGVLIACVFSYLYLFALRCAPYGTAMGSIVFVMVASLGLCIYFMLAEKLSGDWLTQYQNTNSYYKIYTTDYAQYVSKVTAMFLMFVFLFLACTLAETRKMVRQGVGCVKVAVECVFSMPTMLMTPILEAMFKLVAWFALLSGLIWLLATAEVHSGELGEEGDFIYGTSRKLVFTTDQKAMLAFYLMGIIWLVEFTKNFATFMISYAVILWYYTPKPKGCGPGLPLMRGLGVGLFYHLGTIALGSFLIAVTRPFRLTFLFLSRHAKSGEGNAVVSLVASLCSPCIIFTQRNLEFIHQGAYMDVALSSAPFMVAAQNAHGFISADKGKIAALSGTVGVIGFAVVGSVFMVTILTIWTLIAIHMRQMPDDPRERIQNPYFVTLLAGALAASLAATFMVIFEHCADALLYVFLWNKAHGHNTVAKYCPDELAKLMEYKKVSAGDGGRNRPEAPGIFSTLLSSGTSS